MTEGVIYVVRIDLLTTPARGDAGRHGDGVVRRERSRSRAGQDDRRGTCSPPPSRSSSIGPSSAPFTAIGSRDTPASTSGSAPMRRSIGRTRSDVSEIVVMRADGQPVELGTIRASDRAAPGDFRPGVVGEMRPVLDHGSGRIDRSPRPAGRRAARKPIEGVRELSRRPEASGGIPVHRLHDHVLEFLGNARPESLGRRTGAVARNVGSAWNVT